MSIQVFLLALKKFEKFQKKIKKHYIITESK